MFPLAGAGAPDQQQQGLAGGRPLPRGPPQLLRRRLI